MKRLIYLIYQSILTSHQTTFFPFSFSYLANFILDPRSFLFLFLCTPPCLHEELDRSTHPLSWNCNHHLHLQYLLEKVQRFLICSFCSSNYLDIYLLVHGSQIQVSLLPLTLLTYHLQIFDSNYAITMQNRILKQFWASPVRQVHIFCPIFHLDFFHKTKTCALDYLFAFTVDQDSLPAITQIFGFPPSNQKI